MVSNRTLKVTIVGDADDALKALKQMDRELGLVETRGTRVGSALRTGFAAGATAITAGAVAAVAGGVAVFKLANSYAEAGSQIHDLAQRTGLSTEALSEWKYAADQSGTSIEGLEVGIRRMNSTVFDAGNGLKVAKDALAGVGVSVEELRGKKPEEVFERILAGLAGVEDETKRAALATDLFGRSGTQLLPIIADGTQSLADMRKEAHDLGIVFSQEDADAADQFGDDMLRLNREIEGVKNSIARELLPALTPLVTEFKSWIDQNGDEFAHDVAAGIAGIAETAREAFKGLKDIADLGVVKVGIELVGSRSGDELALGALALFIGSKFGLPGLALGALAAGGYAAGKALGDSATPYGGNPNGTGIGPPGSSPLGPLNGPFLTPELQAENARILAQRAGAGGGGFQPGGGSGSAKEDPLVAAWKRIHEQLEKEQQQALNSGGAEQLRITKQLQADLVAETQRMAERAHQAIGVDMSKAVTDSFDLLVDAGKATRDSMEDVTRDIADLAKEMEQSVKEKTAAALGMFQQLINAGFSGANALKFAQEGTGGGLGGGGAFAMDIPSAPPQVWGDTGGGHFGYMNANYGTVNIVQPNVFNGGTPVPSTADSFSE